MIVGHLPAGYLVTRVLAQCADFKTCNRRALMSMGLAGSVLPDIDLAYFYLVDGRQTHHHLYWTHLPVFWLALLVFGIVALTLLWWRDLLPYFYALILNVYVHLALDTIVGDIWWLAPAINKPFSLFTVPALYQPWLLNFLLHWTFLLELALVATALIVRRRSRAMARP